MDSAIKKGVTTKIINCLPNFDENSSQLIGSNENKMFRSYKIIAIRNDENN